ncbi:MAG: hypothetical protein HZB91_12480 [Elusimicrobia bacterium]|nr:hypothetical protein [Elusimicrobiota bacterium]
MTNDRIPVRAAVVASALLLLDAFVLNQAVLPILGGILMVLVDGPGAVLAARRGELDLAWRRGLRAGFFVTAAGLAVAAVRVNNNIAWGRAERVISACGQYRQAKGRYPQSLQELVPEFLPAVPRAKPVAMFSDFRYEPAGNRHRLAWRVFPPRGWKFVFLLGAFGPGVESGQGREGLGRAEVPEHALSAGLAESAP